jgi:D-hydroxyproline dehydrogenase subunit beta
MNRSVYDVVIIGAGIVGAACADELTRQNLRVAVVEKDMIGGGATAAGMGHIVVMDDSAAQFALTRYSQQLWRELQPELPPDVEYEQRGTIWIAADEQEISEALRKQNLYTARGVPAERLDAQALRALEPNLRPGLAGGLLVSQDVVLSPPRAAAFLMQRAQKRGANLHLGHGVTHASRGRVRTTDGSELSAKWLINAAGVCSADLTPGLEIRRRKGHLAITDLHPGFLNHQLVELGYVKSAHSISSDSVAFNVQPRRNGQILIGASRQYGADHPEVDQQILARMLQRAYEYMPGLKKMPAIRTWAGFRPAPSGNLPVIGPWPGDDSLLIASGHEGLGITTSLATARLLADYIAGREPGIPFEPYLPSRTIKENITANQESPVE